MTSKEPYEYVFQAEINQLMSLIINSFYSNREIFLRELISNASDAIDKHRFETLSDGKTVDVEHKIQIIPNKECNTLIFFDNGIGMSKDELIANLGTIARSGTKAFMENMKTDSNKESLIGQFGVGFYSAFLVADTVVVVSKKDSMCHKWISKANGKFQIDEVKDEDELYIVEDHGTKIYLHLKEDQKEYLEENKLKSLVKKHNGFINYPIELFVTKTVSKEVEKEDTTNDATIEDKEEEGQVENVDEIDKSDQEPQKTTIEEIVEEFEKINSDKPIWTKKPEDTTQDEYKSFYKSFTNDWDEPLAIKHFSVEGQLEFKCILFIPKHAPFDMFDNTNKKQKQDNLKLYVKKVFVTDDCESFSPEWMSFVKGIVDCEDLPLNISREFLQQNKVMKIIKKNIMKKVFEMITDLSEEDSKTFYSQFGKNIKIGICNDENHNDKDKLSKLLKFNHTKDENVVSLSEYVENMIDEQDTIYYYCSDNLSSMKNSTYLDKFKNIGIDVLLMNEIIDEYMVQRLNDFTVDSKTYKLQNITRDGLKLPGVKDFEENKDMEEFCKDIKEYFGDKIEKVKQTNIGLYPCNIVSSVYGWSANMERIMKAQALQNNTMHGMMGSKKVFELNIEHQLIKTMYESYSENKKLTITDKNMLQLMMETSMIMCGYTLDNPATYCDKIFKVMNTYQNNVPDESDTTTNDITSDANQNEDIDVSSPMEEID